MSRNALDVFFNPKSVAIVGASETPTSFGYFYTQQLSFDHSLTRAAWTLLEQSDPQWRLSLSASGPAGGQFGRMPDIMTWLAHPESRPDELQTIYSRPGLDLYAGLEVVRSRTGVTLDEIARCAGLYPLF